MLHQNPGLPVSFISLAICTQACSTKDLRMYAVWERSYMQGCCSTRRQILAFTACSSGVMVFVVSVATYKRLRLLLLVLMLPVLRRVFMLLLSFLLILLPLLLLLQMLLLALQNNKNNNYLFDSSTAQQHTLKPNCSLVASVSTATTVNVALCALSSSQHSLTHTHKETHSLTQASQNKPWRAGDKRNEFELFHAHAETVSDVSVACRAQQLFGAFSAGCQQQLYLLKSASSRAAGLHYAHLPAVRYVRLLPFHLFCCCFCFCYCCCCRSCCCCRGEIAVAAAAVAEFCFARSLAHTLLQFIWVNVCSRARSQQY